MKHKRALFIDRDGVIVKEDQVDTYEKIIWIPHVFEALRTISRMRDYALVMVSNQDGVGTPSFPFEDYEKIQKRIFETLEGEGIVFDDINVDYSLPEDNSPGRKPGTMMLKEYLDSTWDMDRSFVIGDRLTDMILARNLGAKGFLLSSDELEIPEDLKDTIILKGGWLDILSYLTDDSTLSPRKAEVWRRTNETDIKISLNLDGTGRHKIETGIGFLNHMLEQLSRHSLFDINLIAKGDLEVDEHHTTEDTALALGEAIRMALSDKRGINRYGFWTVVMDDIKSSVALDFSGRADLTFDASFSRDYIGAFPTELVRHFMKSLSNSALMSLNIECQRGDSHHMAEAIFKALARALRMAVKRLPGDTSLPSTKGVL